MTKKHSNEIAEKDLTEILNLVKIQKVFENYEEESNYRVKVYICEDRNGEKFAVKTCNNLDFFEQELKAIKKVKESGVRVSSFLSETTIVDQELAKRKKHAIKMPIMVEFEDLRDMPEYDLRVNVYARQLMNQMHQLHKIGILHGDIKEDNIMYNAAADELCLIDFGLSLIIDEVVDPSCKDLDLYDVNRILDPPIELFNSFYKAPEILTEENLDEYNKWLKESEDISDQMAEKNSLEIYEKYQRLEEELDSCEDDDRLEEIEKELDELDKEIDRLEVNNLFETYTEMKENEPDAAEAIDYHGEDEINECPLAFCDHITIYADVYALGKMILEYLEIDDLQQEHFLEKMTEADINKRISSRDIFNVPVFNVLKNDESASTETY